jgi:hypothetical protein
MASAPAGRARPPRTPRRACRVHCSYLARCPAYAHDVGEREATCINTTLAVDSAEGIRLETDSKSSALSSDPRSLGAILNTEAPTRARQLPATATATSYLECRHVEVAHPGRRAQQSARASHPAWLPGDRQRRTTGRRAQRRAREHRIRPGCRATVSAGGPTRSQSGAPAAGRPRQTRPLSLAPSRSWSLWQDALAAPRRAQLVRPDWPAAARARQQLDCRAARRSCERRR